MVLGLIYPKYSSVDRKNLQIYKIHIIIYWEMQGSNSIGAVRDWRVSKRILLQRLVSFRVVGEYA